MKKSIELPDDLFREAKRAADDELRSFSGYVTKVLADRLKWKPESEGAPVRAEEVAS